MGAKRRITPKMRAWLAREYPRSASGIRCAEAFERRWGEPISVSHIHAILQQERAAGAPIGRLKPGNRQGASRYGRRHRSFVLQRYMVSTVETIRQEFMAEFGSKISANKIYRIARDGGIGQGRKANLGRFRAGQEPWNKGRKADYLAGTGSEKTRFRPGHRRNLEKPMYSVREDAGGYLEVKLPKPCPHTGRPWRYDSLARWLYSIHHGELPPGRVVIHLDGDRRNVEPDNLASASRAELLALNGRRKGGPETLAVRLAIMRAERAAASPGKQA